MTGGLYGRMLVGMQQKLSASNVVYRLQAGFFVGKSVGKLQRTEIFPSTESRA
jgi:hypothetical protein